MKPDFSLIPEPDRSVEARKPLSKKQRAELLLLQNGYCGCGCGVKVNHPVEGSIDEHMRPLGLQGSNDLTNRQIWRKPCSDAKTYKIDLPTIRKAQAQAGERGSQTHRRENAGGSKLQGRPFQKGVKRAWGSRPFPKREK